MFFSELARGGFEGPKRLVDIFSLSRINCGLHLKTRLFRTEAMQFSQLKPVYTFVDSGKA